MTSKHPSPTNPATPAEHSYRCDTCDFKSPLSADSGMCGCSKSKRNITWQQWCIIRDVGCASHSNAQGRIAFNSTELLLLANDEWKRREERKHLHENTPWISGFINGFCTDKKWAREYVNALLQAGEGK